MHDHTHSSDESSQRIGWAFVLNVGFTIIEFVGGLLTNSTAIMADAVHDLGDSLSIGTAWVLSLLSKKEADSSFTYGYKRLSLIGALINGFVLIAGSSWVLLQAIPRLFDPVMPAAEGMLALAILGVAVNGFAAYKLSAGTTLNEKVLNWHLLEDVLGWAAILIVSIVLLVVEAPILDPLLAIGFTLFILFNVTRNTWYAVKLFVQAVPERGLIERVREELSKIPQVASIHHEHAWSLDGESTVYTAHLEMGSAMSAEEQLDAKKQIADLLQKFQFSHTTIELEFPHEDCRDED
ncbi:MAG: cation diffusion facilitator family transporter [Gammaproteobacteria bacterium]|jgi:cobalt-zinc-cadmium efflux system protein|nr:cation diffusion facilitator family transporter [Gammaproteobacteria bacterium]MDD9894379.1 cation diffusion facilitator family transporter [Gammaproteobacteria bacterium]MDD9960358.1 cation diffusion facilitator family transporter [Gammaproteobacteria bacterium]